MFMVVIYPMYYIIFLSINFNLSMDSENDKYCNFSVSRKLVIKTNTIHTVVVLFNHNIHIMNNINCEMKTTLSLCIRKRNGSKVWNKYNIILYAV